MASLGSFQTLEAKEPDSTITPPPIISAKAEGALDTALKPSEKPTSLVRNPTLRNNNTSPARHSVHRSRSRNPRKGIISPDQKSKDHNIVWVDGQSSAADEQITGSDHPSSTMTATHTRRNASGTVGSVFSGNKIRHLKKEDGIPLWRKDIQLEFLRCVFEDDTKCFTMASDGTKGHTFAETYIDAMARSSKTSKVLREKLFNDQAGAMSMAMICLLVNVGRMNTTLNFFPEMRAQLRTFHAIPSLQANRDPNAYKQLQDAPRLKSILKGASEDLNQPSTIEKIKTTAIPRTNPVHLIFVLSQYAPKISEAHFQPPRDFFDLVMRGTLSSKSRARAFLWLIWWYLESDFSAEKALKNPFGPGQEGEGTDGLPIKVPPFEHLTEAQADAENVDTESEKQYGELKRIERRKILEEDETVGPPLKKQKKGNDDAIIAISDTDPTRTPSPSSTLHRKPSVDFPTHTFPAPSPSTEIATSHTRYPNIASKTDPSNPHRLVLKTRMDNPLSSSPPLPPGSGHPILSAVSNGNRRPRPETSHQKAVNINRKMRIDHILHKQMRSYQNQVRRQKRRVTSSFGMMVMNRVKDLPDTYDTDEETSWGPGGLVANSNETDDYGEEALKYKKVIDRAIRRLYRLENVGPVGGLLKRYQRRRRRSRVFGEGQRSRRRNEAQRGNSLRSDGRSEKPQGGTAYEGQLDDLDLDLLGENRDDDQDRDSGSDATEGDDGEMTEEDLRVET